MPDMAEKVAKIDEAIFHPQTGLQIRTTKLEWFTKALIGAIGLGFGWAMLQVLQTILTAKLSQGP